MHWKRWITALVGLPLLILLVLKGGPTLFALAIAAVAVIAMWEYFRIVLAEHSPRVPGYFLLWSYIAGAAVVLVVPYHGFQAVMALFALHLIGAAAMSILRYKQSTDAPAVVLKQVFGVLYIAGFLAFFVLLYHDPHGVHWVFFLFVVVAAGDTGAYYAGRTFGRRKLCPAVSPKKTVEGALGGLVGSLVLAVAYKLVFMPFLSLPGCVLFALLVGSVGQIGDLFESEFKRSAGVKDSSNLLPGHGGFLDRIDALLFALPVAYLLKEYLLT
ncbi:phosphatidate cytidylyltransferase [Desulfatitalea alkaliphila]|uniref:Phosphatidate cytidylyltransferase n=1 Tax=Desulfatitalea alkaliphila TaxID=2929485 RepID=A0AA41UIF2_9BACT|nr:phosphatidate cytidylyltransferase [Desulfatitalea alkaliphila]MCJ8500024.1 phosphatidate cytidylyltransferase [Desulfatitalea alkaliphila]